MSNLVIEVWKGDWGLPSTDVDCLRALAYMKFIGVPIKIDQGNPFFSPKASLPVLRSGRKSFSNFDEIVEHLKVLNFNTDVHLDSKQFSEVSAFTQYLRDKLYPAMKYSWWIDEKNYSGLIRPTYAKALRIPFCFYYPNKFYKNAHKIIDALYGEHSNLDEVESALFKESEKCFKTLSDRLGESEYFFGNRPSSFDATVFAYLAPILKAPLPNNTLQTQLKNNANLVKFVEQICRKFFKQSGLDYSKTSAKINGTTSDKDVSAFPNATRNKVLAAIIAIVAMTSFGIANGLFEVNFRDDYDNRQYNELFENEEEE